MFYVSAGCRMSLNAPRVSCEVKSGMIFLKQNYLNFPTVILLMTTPTHYLTFCFSISELCVWSVFEKEHIASEAECLHFQAKELGGNFRIDYFRIISFQVAQLVEALSYKPAGRGFDSRWCH